MDKPVNWIVVGSMLRLCLVINEVRLLSLVR
jgi:hypothetical protein